MPENREETREMPTVYLIHFHRKYHHAGHYLGFVDGGDEELQARLDRHRAGTGARLMEVITGAGITWEVTRTWIGSRRFERRLKKRKNAAKLCPVCRAAREERRTCSRPQRRKAA